MGGFVHQSWQQRVVFGRGSRKRILEELAALGVERAFVITGGSVAPVGQAVAQDLEGKLAALFPEVVQHVPEELAARATDAAQRVSADAIVSVGGGSATGLAKAVAVRLGIPIVAVPTTYAGSEMTPIWATTGRRKHTARDARAVPACVLYDPLLTLDLPPHVSAASGMNALAQAVAALTYKAADPITILYAKEAIRVLPAALRAAADDPSEIEHREQALYGAHLAARALSTSETGVHHALAHVLGGSHRLVHADVHAVLLPHTTALLSRIAPETFHRLREALSTEEPAAALSVLALDIGAPTNLASLGVPETVLATVVEELAQHDGRLPADDLAKLLDDAYAGRLEACQ